MRAAKDCLRQAQHAEQLALKTSDPRSKATLLEIAQHWRDLIVKDVGLVERTASCEEIKEPAHDGQ
jgi:hypothetical protein